ncbi:MAG: LytTR family DNA-binding domain-containing protein [Pseudomonadota bacterium]
MSDWLRRGLRGSVVLVGAALLFSWFGVYDTYRLDFVPRFGFWMLTMVVGGTSAAVVAPWVMNGPARDLPHWLRGIVVAALVSIPITAVLLLINDGPLSIRVAIIQFGYVFVVSVVVTSVMWYFQEAGDVDADDAKTTPDPVVRFLERLPVKYRSAELYAVSAEDHYLRVHTSLGEDLILMRFSDAMKELEGAAGLQTHRSWWVAKTGVADSRRDAGKLVLVLKSGGEASVSRTYSGAVKEAGLV